jgi:predicted phage terminase large subunit-like protein
MTKTTEKNILKNLTEKQRQEYIEAKIAIKLDEAKKKTSGDFLNFVKHMWPDFINGRHHRIIADKFNKLAEGKIDRLIVNMPPRHTKSEFASYFLPAWMIAKNPKLKIIQTTHTADLAVDFGRKVKHLLDDPSYQELFDTRLMEDSQAAGKWKTEQGGEYFAAGVGGAITGRGADLLIIDDPHKEQDIKRDGKAFDKAWNWYLSGPRQRLQPGGRIVVVMTRWSTKDLTARLIESQAAEEGADKWDIIEFPAIMGNGKPCWPEYWEIDQLLKTQASLPVASWNAQYMQQPTAEQGAILKREWWRNWASERMPKPIFVLQSIDTAFLKKESADYSAITTWGVFNNQDEGQQAILLDAQRGRWEFPELKEKAHRLAIRYNANKVLIEAKAAGIPLYHELFRVGIPVTNWTPSRGNDKYARVHSVSPIFEGGRIWAPMHRHYAQEVVEECASFPHGDHDDYVDSTTQAIMHLRGSMELVLSDDEQPKPVQKERIEYYG